MKDFLTQAWAKLAPKMKFAPTLQLLLFEIESFVPDR
jgi:hypothetical protein